MDYWEPGTQIMWRAGGPAHDWVQPMTVVRDDERGLVAWLAVDTPIVRLERADGRDLRTEVRAARAAGRDVKAVVESFGRVPGVRVASTWQATDVLRVVPTGEPWSVWHFFDGTTGEFQGWYVNFELPHVREPFATRTIDLALDLWVTPDRVAHRKDEDELAFAVERGRLTQHDADRILAVCAEVEAIVAAWRSPFCDGWETFRPDPSWPVPRLLDGELATPASLPT